MGNITELKLDEIDYEIKRLNKELPHLELMFEIWNLKNQLPKVKGEIVPDGVDENDLQITETPAIGEWGLIIYRKIREREKELRGLGLRLLSYGEVTFNLERTREEINRLCNIRRKKLELEDTPASTPQKQGKTNDKETKQIRNSGKASFDKVNLTINIDGKPFIFKDTKEYQLFEFLYENQHRRLKKDEIKKELDMGRYAEQQVFNLITKLRKTIKTTSYEIENKKEYDDRGGYLLILKK